MQRHKRLSEMAKQLNKHVNTIAKWCDAIESANIHQFERSNGERVFNERDQIVIKYVNDKRDAQWPIPQIIQQIRIDLDLTPHVEHMSQQLIPLDTPDAEIIKQQIIDAMQQAIDRAVEIQVQQVREHYERMIAALPKPPDEAEQQMAIISAMLIKERAERELRQEAIAKWPEQPERKKRAFLWIWREDLEKREAYINEYITRHLADKIKQLQEG